MPVYEYHCKNCRRKVALLVKGFSSPPEPICPHCGGSEMVRLFSTFSVRRSFEDDYERILSDNKLVSGLEHDDPRALAEWGRRMSRSMEDDSASPEWEDMMYNLEQGRMPDDMGGQETEKDTGDEGEE